MKPGLNKRIVDDFYLCFTNHVGIMEVMARYQEVKCSRRRACELIVAYMRDMYMLKQDGVTNEEG